MINMNNTFEFKQYSKCQFFVSHYIADDKAIAIIIKDSATDEPICKCTKYDEFLEYEIGIATIKNYSENAGMTEFLRNLKIVEEIKKSYKVNDMAEDTETVDICKINLEELKAYAEEWKYAESEEI